MKKNIITLITFLAIAFSNVNAQIRISTSVLANVVTLFSQSSQGLKSNLIESKSNAKTYASTVVLNGAIDAKYIEYFHPAKPENAIGTRMQSIFYEGTSFTAAQKKFKAIYKNLNKTTVKYNEVEHELNNEYITPLESKTCTTINYVILGKKKMIFSIAIFKKADKWITELDVYESSLTGSAD